MNRLVFIESGLAVTDSLTVADVFRKEHSNVLKDIRKQIEYAGEEFAEVNFYLGQYLDKNKQSRPKYNLTEEAFALIAFSYNTKEAVQTKISFIQEFKRMKATLQTVSSPSYMIEDPIDRAQKWIEEQKQRLMLEQQVAEAQPKVTYYDTILKSTKLLSVTQIAKDYGLSGQALNKVLHEEGIQYKLGGQWLLYQQHANKGYTKSHTYIDSTGEARMNTKWTQKGRLFVHEILIRLGYDPDKKIA